MKKNRMMRLASVLLVCVLLTTSVISGTFAKYTTQDAAEDSARVAKWGVELQVVGNLYGESYKDEIVAGTDNGENITVQAVDYYVGNDILAPGTKNEDGLTFSLEGKPEVDGEVTTELKVQNVYLKNNTYGVMIPVDKTVITADNFDEFAAGTLYHKINTSYYVADHFDPAMDFYTLEDQVYFTETYYPVVYHLKGATNSNSEAISNDSMLRAAALIVGQLGLTENTTADEKAKNITSYTGVKSFEANTDLASWAMVDQTLTWEWNFEVDDKVGDKANWTDMADTILGLLYDDTTTPEGEVVKLTADSSAYVPVVAYEDYCLETMFSLDITVTQVN